MEQNMEHEMESGFSISGLCGLFLVAKKSGMEKKMEAITVLLEIL